jgi:virulence plasmid B protein
MSHDPGAGQDDGVNPAVVGAIVGTDRVDSSDLAATVGRTPGSFDVTSDGAATYTVPLWVPPGRAGMEPELSLVYHSRAGNGPLGVGWSLGGLSQIVRCAATLASDGSAGPVRFDSHDRLSLDGDYLIPVPAGGHAHKGELRPEHRPFAKVLIDDEDGLGPISFTLLAEDGRILFGGGGATITGRRLAWSPGATAALPASLDTSLAGARPRRPITTSATRYRANWGSTRSPRRSTSAAGTGGGRRRPRPRPRFRPGSAQVGERHRAHADWRCKRPLDNGGFLHPFGPLLAIVRRRDKRSPAVLPNTLPSW